MKKQIIIYSLAPICLRCVKTDALLERMCSGKNVQLIKRNWAQSAFYLILKFKKPPVILVEGRLVCAGRVPREEEITSWLA